MSNENQWTEPDFTRIEGLSDRVMFPRCGRIRLGVKKEAHGGKSYPVETDYFVFDQAILEEFPALAEAYGPKRYSGTGPKRLDIVLVSDDLREVFPQAYKFYGRSTGLRCIGNGKRCWRFVCREHKTFHCDCPDPPVDRVEGECSGKQCPVYQQGSCSERGILSFMLPKITMEGLFVIETQSSSAMGNIVRINSGLKLVLAMLGRLAFVPLVLRRVPVAMKHDGKLRTHYLLSIGYAGDLDQARRLREAAGSSASGLLTAGTCTPLPPSNVEGENPGAGTGLPAAAGAGVEPQMNADDADQPDGDDPVGGAHPVEQLPPQEPGADPFQATFQAEAQGEEAEAPELQYPEGIPYEHGLPAITPKQKHAIHDLIERARLTTDEQGKMLEPFGRPGISVMTLPQASALIEWLNKVVGERKAGKGQ